MTILALDLGKYKSVSCMYTRGRGDEEARFETVATSREEFSRLIADHKPELVVFETCSAAGWVADLCGDLGVPCRFGGEHPGTGSERKTITTQTPG